MAEDDVCRAAWRKSSYSGSSGGECVEVARLDSVNVMRDSKNPDRGFLAVKREAWSSLLAKIKRGSYDF